MERIEINESLTAWFPSLDPTGTIASVEEQEPIGGPGSGRRKIFDGPSSQHNVTFPNELWLRLVAIAGGPRKVSALLINIVTDYVNSQEPANIRKKSESE